LPGEPEKRATMVAENIKNKQGKTINGYHAQNVKNLHGQYYSITAQLSKTFDFGLNAMVAYTKSGSTALSDGNGDQLGEFANIITKSGSNTTELGYTEYVAPSRVIANLGYDLTEGKHFATHFGLFFEGINAAYIENGSKSRYTYTMANVSGGSAQQVLYIPTDADLANMPFADDANKAAYKSFIEGDKYLSAHRGEYETRNAIKSPWLNRINFHVAQDFNFNGIGGKTNTIQLALDINNLGNMINSNWGTYDYLKSKQVLAFKNGVYTFTEPVWNKQMSTASTWSMLFSVKYSF
ncbi:MAG: hypothetical protein MJZ16_07630, partial [Bacteroidales bacterium]|nr:hypothetical protein [Bacteroidales bacterium]